MIILFEDLNNRSVGPVSSNNPVAPVAPRGLVVLTIEQQQKLVLHLSLSFILGKAFSYIYIFAPCSNI